MRLYHLILLGIILSSLFSCTQGSKKITLVKVNLVIDEKPDFIFPDSIKQNSIFNLKIWINNKKYKLKSAYCGCQHGYTDSVFINSENYRIAGCENKMIRLKNDTATLRIYTGTGVGKQETLKDLTLIIANENDSVFYDTFNSSFNVEK